jgi:hypothetical protein
MAMEDQGNSDYYLSRIDKYWKQLGRLFKSSEKILPKYLDDIVAVNIRESTYTEFKRILAELPYIGGDGNMLTFTFVSSAAALAYFRVLESHGLPIDTIGKTLNEVYEDVFTSLPGLVRWWLRWSEFSNGHMNKLKIYAMQSQSRKYPGDWVMEYIESDGEDFDFGCNYTECAVLKFYRQMGAQDYMPYICVMDFTMSRALRTGLQRTTTLHYGGDCCDFRYKKNRLGTRALPIENLPEYNNRMIE